MDPENQNIPPPVPTTQVESQASFVFSIHLSDTVLYSLGANHTSQLVGFLFKIASEMRNEEHFWFQVHILVITTLQLKQNAWLRPNENIS